MPKHDMKFSPDRSNQIASAMEALEEARGLPPGPPRIQALKQAGLLRHAADNQGLIFAKRGRPRGK
jgi:hypothetical protein